jgi:DNA-binding transcriptional LysR family regulator
MRTFEAAARLKSFSRAGLELNVSQAAVSRQIKVLEADLGIRLFERGYRGIELTPPAAHLSNVLAQSFESISEAVEGIRSARKPRLIRVGTTVAFSHFRLLPRLKTLREEYSNLNIRVIARDEAFDLRRDEVDIIMRFGVPPFEDGVIVSQVRDNVFPVCSPTLKAKIGDGDDLFALRSAPLIGTDAQNRTWMNWAEWFSQSGFKDLNPVVELDFNYYTDGIAAALAGQGIALGWDFVVRDLLMSGQLVRLTGKSVPSHATYNVVVSRSGLKNQLIQDASEWFSRMFDEYRNCADEDRGERSGLPVGEST